MVTPSWWSATHSPGTEVFNRHNKQDRRPHGKGKWMSRAIADMLGYQNMYFKNPFFIHTNLKQCEAWYSVKSCWKLLAGIWRGCHFLWVFNLHSLLHLVPQCYSGFLGMVFWLTDGCWDRSGISHGKMLFGTDAKVQIEVQVCILHLSEILPWVKKAFTRKFSLQLLWFYKILFLEK